MYRILYEPIETEIIEKKSRFICSMKQVKKEEDAIEFIEKIRKTHYNAKHNCFAYIVNEDNNQSVEIKRYSDDKEPPMTAGKPMLDILIAEELHNVVAVVTRYFGGTLLGTGGLVRAYQSAVKEAINNAKILERKEAIMLNTRLEYSEVKKMQFLISKHKAILHETSYEDKVIMNVLIDCELKEAFVNELIEYKKGDEDIKESGNINYCLIDDKHFIM